MRISVPKRLSKIFLGLGGRTTVWAFIAAALFVVAIVVSATRHGALGHAMNTDELAIEASYNEVETPAPTVKSPSIEVTDSSKIETRLAFVSGRIDTTLFEDGQTAGLSDALILKLVEIFGWDIDFALGIRPGDTFAVVHEEKYWLGQKIGDGPILAAEFVNRGRPYHAFGFREDGGVTTYYELDGMTKRKRFLRTPIEFSRISSYYTEKAGRFHPIRKIWIAHLGVDYASPAGTPIRATATGRIMKMEPKGGYGNLLVIRHDSAFETYYAHLSRFANNLRVGSFVEQGQIIGYVGQTGLATGPHLHYEFRINGAHRDPLKFRSPGAVPVPEEQRKAFFAQTADLITQLDLIASRQLASTQQ